MSKHILDELILKRTYLQLQQWGISVDKIGQGFGREGWSGMTSQINRDNRYKIYKFIVLLFVLIIVLTSRLTYSQTILDFGRLKTRSIIAQLSKLVNSPSTAKNQDRILGYISIYQSQTISEAKNWLRKFVYLYELPNTSPKQVLLKVQSDFTWHSLLLTEKGNYWYQLSPGAEQQFPAFAQAMLGVKVEYNEISTNIKTENRIWAFREAVNAPKGSGPFGSLAMGYFVEKFRRAPLSTLIVDNISLGLINITKILESKDPSSDNKKLLANFGLEKANATVLDFERMRQDKTLIKGEPAFQNAYFQQIQSWQPITKTTKSSDDITSANNMKANPIIVDVLVIIIMLVLVGWIITYYITRSAIKRVTQSLSELREKMGSPKSIHSENLLSQLKNDFAGIISTQNEKISRLGENIVGIVEQLKENQDTTTKLCQVMFDIQEQAKQFTEKLTGLGDISATVKQWEELKSKLRLIENDIHLVADVINQLKDLVDEGALTQLEQFADEGVLQQLEQLASKLPIFEEDVIAEEAEINYQITTTAMEAKFYSITQRWEEFERKFQPLENELDSIADVINQLRDFVDDGVLTKLEQLPQKFKETETIIKRLKNIDRIAITPIEEFHPPIKQLSKSNGTLQNDIIFLELDINIEEGKKGKIRRGRDNHIFVSFSNPNQFSVNVTDIEIDLTDFETDLPLVIPPKESLRFEANFDASEVKEKKVEVSCYVSYEGLGRKREEEIQIELETIGVYVQSLDDGFDI